ncbi:hypothetical protein CsSME_00037720 [Camellia sinensis var. sinensis]
MWLKETAGVKSCNIKASESLVFEYHLWTSGAHLICYPGAFNMTTGPLHWELLQRARAADNQYFCLHSSHES